ncbi:MAG: hypothetical protein II956_15460 [Bacteroidales bacterium]|nr:hypothetical protein [Bacteroidales bacterium]
MKKISLLLAMAVMIAACNPYGSEIPRKLAGNWINEKNGNYDYGFFEEFAIAQSNFWKYKSVSDNEIVLQNDKTISLNVNILNDSTITVNGEKYFKIVYPDGVEKTHPLEVKKIADLYLSKMSYFPDVKEDTTDFAPYVYNRTDSAKVLLYERNTAKGWQSFQRRFHSSNYKRCVALNGSTGYWGFYSPLIDSTEHYGERAVFDALVESVCEIDCGFLFEDWFTKFYLPTIIEPNDTLVISFSRETFDIYGYRNEHYVSGSNQRFYREQDLFFNYLVSNEKNDWSDDDFDGLYKKYVEDSTRLENFIAQCKMPLSKKFVHYNKNVMLYRFASEIVGYEGAEEFFKQNPQIFNEQEILLSRWGVEFMLKYSRRMYPQELKKLGFSDDFWKLIEKVKEREENN